MCADTCRRVDAVIVGSGIAGALIARKLGKAGKKVLILEAGEPIPPDINGYMEKFFTASIKVPESPYPPEIAEPGVGPLGLPDPAKLNVGRQNSLMLAPDSWKDPRKSYAVQTGPMPFGSTYERVGGGTAMHWLGTSLRLLESDFEMASRFGQLQSASTSAQPKWVDWPIKYKDLQHFYEEAEAELGVAADKQEQRYLGIDKGAYDFPMPGIPKSFLDTQVDAAVKRLNQKPDKLAFLKLDPGKSALEVTGTPAARNSQPYQGRRVCAGNTNCIPICPIQAKYDPTITLHEAFATGSVDILYRTVAYEVVLADNQSDVAQIKYKRYEKGRQGQGPVEEGCVTATVYIIAANAIETPRLLLMSNKQLPAGVANSTGLVGRNLMDHPYFVSWARTKDPVFPYRGPLSTAGIENVRDGDFRRERGAFRVEIGNEGWNFVVGGVGGDPNATTLDFVNGTNFSGVNVKGPNGGPEKPLLGRALATRLNEEITRQLRLGFLIEQPPDPNNLVALSKTETDGLGLPRPEIHYDLSPYTKLGIAAAARTADAIFEAMEATKLKAVTATDPFAFSIDIDGKSATLNYLGAGHIMGTCRMGKDANDSVVDSFQRCHKHPNLFLVGSATFPTSGTANPTLTIAALSLRTAEEVINRLR